MTRYVSYLDCAECGEPGTPFDTITCPRCETRLHPSCGDVHWKRHLAQQRQAMKRTTKNPARRMMTRRGQHLPGYVTQIRYYRSGGRNYYHDFKPGVRHELLPDGSVRLYHPRRRVWADDREPGFDRYRHHGNPGGRGRSMNLTTVALIAAGIYLGVKSGLISSGAAAETPAWGRQQPIRFWIDTATGTIVDRPSLVPPGPTYRPASETELYIAAADVAYG